jgi:hypothetical protein
MHNRGELRRIATIGIFLLAGKRPRDRSDGLSDTARCRSHFMPRTTGNAPAISRTHMPAHHDGRSYVLSQNNPKFGFAACAGEPKSSRDHHVA